MQKIQNQYTNLLIGQAFPVFTRTGPHVYVNVGVRFIEPVKNYQNNSGRINPTPTPKTIFVYYELKILYNFTQYEFKISQLSNIKILHISIFYRLYAIRYTLYAPR